MNKTDKEKEKEKEKEKPPPTPGKSIIFCQHIKRNEILLVLEDG